MKKRIKTKCYSIVSGVVLFLALFSFGRAAAQSVASSQFLRVDTVLNFKGDRVLGYADPVCASFGDFFAFTCYDTYYGSDTVVVYKVNTKTYGVDTIRLYEKRLCKRMKKAKYNHFKELMMDADRIFLVYGKEVLVFRQSPSGDYERHARMTYPKSYKTAALLNGSLAVFSNCYYPDEPSTDLTIFDINKGEVVSSVSPCASATFTTFSSGRRLVANGVDRLAWFDPDGYSFAVYDSKLDKVDSVAGGIVWKTFPDSVLRGVRRIDKHAAADIIRRLKGHFLGIDVVLGAYFLDAHTMMVVRRPPISTVVQGMIDIWQHRGGQWRCTMPGVVDPYWPSAEVGILTKDNMPLNALFGEDVRTVAGKIAVLSDKGCVDNPFGMNAEEYVEEGNRYLLKNDYFYQLFIYSQTFTSEQ